MSEKYRDAGVDLNAAAESVSRITPLVERTRRPGMIGAPGGFGGLFSLREAGFTSDSEGAGDLILVSGTDGVGTKLELAIALDRVDTIGIDCVAMCVNDVLTTGAEPLFFLDYIATGSLDPDQIADIVRGISDACLESGCALLGGETAEMPGFYKNGHFDLAGFCVGAVQRQDMFCPKETIRPGDRLIALASSGIHSNGFSLIRKLIADHNLNLSEPHPALLADKTLGEHLLTPTRLYGETLECFKESDFDVKGAAHITGGGITENLARLLPPDLSARIDLDSWEPDPLFGLMQELSQLDDMEAHQVFNMGVGMILVVRPHEAFDATLRKIKTQLTHAVWELGVITDQKAAKVAFERA